MKMKTRQTNIITSIKKPVNNMDEKQISDD